MIITTFPWHHVGTLGMPRRMPTYDYANPDIAPQAMSVSMSAFGGLLLVVPGIFFFAILIRDHRSPEADPGEYRFSVAVHPPQRVPAALNA